MKRLGMELLLSLLLLFASLQNSHCSSFALSDKPVENEMLTKIDSLNNESYKLNYADGNKAVALAEQALSLARDATYMAGIAQSFYNISIVYKNTGQYPKAIAMADSALYFYSLSANKVGEASVYNNLGTVYYYLANNLSDTD